MPSYWLLKTEPSVYSYADLERDGTTVWNGVTNNLALKHLRSVKKGDFILIYHTGDEKKIVGIAEIASNPYPDPKENDPRLTVVDVKAKKKLSKSVTLAEIKIRNQFADFDLVRLPRLSVMPVTESQWKSLMKMAQ